MPSSTPTAIRSERLRNRSRSERPEKKPVWERRRGNLGSSDARVTRIQASGASPRGLQVAVGPNPSLKRPKRFTGSSLSAQTLDH